MRKGTYRQKTKKVKVTHENKNYDMFVVDHDDHDYYQTFKINSDEPERGIYFGDSDRSIIFLKNHECEPDILESCEHEDIHAGIYHSLLEEEDETFLSINDFTRCDVFFEHKIIRMMQWIDEYLEDD